MNLGLGRFKVWFTGFGPAFSPFLDLHDISLVHISTHGNLCSFNDILGLLLIKHNCSDLFFHTFVDVLTSFQEIYQSRENLIVVNYLGELGEVP